MATVFIPPQMRDLTGGVPQVEVEGKTLRQLVQGLEERFPAISERLLEGEVLAPGLAVAIDGELSTLGLFARVGPDSRIHILPAISGG